ncbi:MAG: serine/threonine-protein kinase [Pseudomonadota bacterium]
MPPSNFNFEKALDDLLAASPSARATMLQTVASDHPEAAQRLERLLNLALDDQSAPYSIDQTAPSLFSEMLLKEDLDRVGSEVGPFKITALVDRGGMGIVFKAERCDGVYEQTVAVKFLPRFQHTEKQRQLFLDERSNLARLEHPNIARIIDAGVTGDDMPYFVMEYVAGEPIDIYCAPLSEARRLAVFLQVCDAVSYCHQSFVVHGDVKPANILVADDRARLLDFGVGKWTGKSYDGHPTGFSAGYAAPELKSGQPHSVASDIYALGCLLRTLLSGGNAVVSHDLSLVIEQCTAASATDRFASVDALRLEIAAYLDGYPISSRRNETRYVFRKFLGRNRLVVTAIAAVVASLSTGLAATWWQYSQATVEARRANETATFVRSLFDRVDPEVAGNVDITLRDVMDEAALRIDRELQTSHEIRHDIMALIASGYQGLGDSEKALMFAERVLDYHDTTKPMPHEKRALALGDIGPMYTSIGDYDRAREVMQRAIAEYQALGMDDTLAFADVLGSTPLLYPTGGQTKEQIQISIDNLERKGEILAALAPNDVYLKYVHLSNLASVHEANRDFERGARLKEEALQIAEENGYTLRTSAITVLCNLGYSYDGLGRLHDAIATYTKCIERTKQRFGDDYVGLVSAQLNVAAAYIALGQFDTAKSALLEATKIAEGALPNDSFTRLALEINLARANVYLGNSEQALRALPDILRRMQATVGEQTPAAGRVQSILGKALLETGMIDEATDNLREAYTLIQSGPQWTSPGNQWASDVTLWRAEAELAAGNAEVARALAAAGSKIRREEVNVQPWRLAEATRIRDAADAFTD